MNVIKVMGGLGNQLFQYAFGKAQMLNGIDVAFDTSFYNNKMKWPRPYRLDKFIPVKQSPFLNQPIIKGHKRGFDKGLLKLSNHNFDGYWQYKEYYEDILNELRMDLFIDPDFHTAEFRSLYYYIDTCDSISIHVRRGDYLVQTWGILPFSYYLNALTQISGKKIFIFSDDIPWCKLHFKKEYFSKEIMFVDVEDYLAFELMKTCKHNIIGSSTFSWWAAVLNSNPNKTVVAPSQWLGETKKNPFDYIYPLNWKVC